MILVTGGTGFLGSYIIWHLVETGHQVRALRRTEASQKNKVPFWIPAGIFEKIEWVEGDVLDVVALEEAMNGVEQVIHSAALVSFHKRDQKLMYQVNVDGTANVVNVALEKKVKKLIHVSSVAALGRTAHASRVNEETKWEDSKSNTHYAKSKHKAELHVWRAMAEGIDAVIVNPSTILGFGDWHSSSCAIFRQVYNGFDWYTAGVNGFVDVDDVAKAIIGLMESTVTEQRFIINSDDWTFQKLQETIADNFQKKRPHKLATPALLALAWRIEKLKSLFTKHRPLLTRESAKVAQSKTWFENHKILNTLPGFSFTPLEKTIKNACEKYAGIIPAVQP